MYFYFGFCYTKTVGDFMKLLKICVIVSLVLLFTACGNKESDAIRFKKEYESLNSKKSASGHKIKNIKISKKNPIKYSNYDEVIDVIKNKTGVIYLGYPECPWCRTALPVLLEAANDYKIDTIYYINIKDDRDYYEVKNGKVVYQKDESGKEKKGSDGYFKLVKVLDKELKDYIIKDEDGKEYNVGEKRIYVPFIVFVHEGKIIGTHTSTVDTQENGYDDLTDDEYDELNGIYADYIKKLVNNYCDEAC